MSSSSHPEMDKIYYEWYESGTSHAPCVGFSLLFLKNKKKIWESGWCTRLHVDSFSQEDDPTYFKKI